MPPEPDVLSSVDVHRVDRGAVLVAEDDRDLRDIIRSFLDAKQWRVVACAHDPGIIELALGGCFDFVVLDIRSVACSGLRVLHELRASGSSIPVVAITSFGDAFLAQRVRRMGATTVLEKPFDLDELGGILDRAGPA